MTLKCPRDWIFTIVYVLLMCVLAGIVIYVILNARPYLLVKSTDNDGNVCGHGEMEKKPNLYFFDITSCIAGKNIIKFLIKREWVCKAPRICVEDCPSHFGPPTLQNHVCKPNVSVKTEEDLKIQIKANNCSSFIIPTFNIINVCLPDIKKMEELVKTKTNIDLDIFNKIISNERLINTLVAAQKRFTLILKEIISLKWLFILHGLIIFIIAYLLIIIISILTNVLIIVFYVVVMTASLSSTVFCTYVSIYMPPKIINANFLQAGINFLKIQTNSDIKTVFIGLAVASGIIFIIFLILGCLIGGGIRNANKCIHHSIKYSWLYIPYVPSCLITIIFQAAIFISFFVFLLMLYTCSEKEYRYFTISDGKIVVGEKCILGSENKASIKCIFSGYYANYLHILFAIIASYVILCQYFLVSNMNVFSIAYTYSQVYQHPNKRGFFSIVFILIKGSLRAFSTNFGSLAFSSFISMFFMLLIVLLQFMNRLMGFEIDSKYNVFSKPVLWVLTGIRSLVERISQNVVIYMAITNKPFCASSFQILRLFFKYPRQIIVLKLFCLMISVFGISFCSCLSGYIMYLHLFYYYKHIINKIIISVIFGLFSLIINWIIFKVFGILALTVHYCICLDLEVNDGSEERPLKMDKDLEEVYKRENKTEV